MSSSAPDDLVFLLLGLLVLVAALLFPKQDYRDRDDPSDPPDRQP